MTMKNPPHPGLSVRHDCIEPLRLTITEAATALGVTRQTLNNLVNGKSGISADMAIRLGKAFGGDAEAWLPYPGVVIFCMVITTDGRPFRGKTSL